MPSDNERTVREAWAAMNASKDPEAIASYATEDCEAYTRMSSITGAPYVGHEGIREWAREVEEQFSEFTIDLSEVTEVSPGKVFAMGRADVRGKGSDLPWREDVFYALTFEAGKVKTLRMFLDRGSAEASLAE